MLIVFTTCESEGDAHNLAEKIVTEKLAGCVQIMPKIRSVYRWEGKVVSESESLLLVKTDSDHYPSLEAFIKKEHQYDVPEIVAVPVENVSEDYKNWLSGVLS